MRYSSIHSGFLVLLYGFLALAAHAQSPSTATIVGKVADPQGAVVVNARITATNEATNASRVVTTTSAGDYVIPNLPPGVYDIAVDLQGFKPAQVKGIKLNVGDRRDVNLKLAVGGSSETVEVGGGAPLIETTKTDISTTVTSLDVERLPITLSATGANDYIQLALVVPGVKLDATDGSNAVSLNALIGPGSVNNRGNLYNVDGANITDVLLTGRDGRGASVDELQEFQVITNNYNAEYGQAGGVVVNAVTKSGGNSVHGEGHMYFRGRNLGASDPFTNLNFLNANGTVVDPRCPHVGSQGDIDGCPRSPFHRKEGGFTIGGPFIKDKLFWFGSYELSQQAVPLSGQPNGVPFTVQQPFNNLLYSGKVDYNISSKHVLTARYHVDRSINDNVVIATQNPTPNSLTTTETHVLGMNVGLVSTLTPTIVNEVRATFLRTLFNGPADKTTQPGQQHPTFYTGAAFCCPQGGLNKRYQYLDNLTWSHGKHTLKMGFDISYYPWVSIFQQFHFGEYFVNASNVPTSFTFSTGAAQAASKDNIYGFYLQDTWKLTHNLTMNYGLRYDVEAGGLKGGTVPAPGGGCFQANGIIPSCSSDKNNWQPRLGFTYSPWKDTLFKASFAEITELAFNNVALDSLTFDGVSSRTVTTSDPAVLAAFPNFPNPALLVGPACPPNCGVVRPISTHLRNPEIRAFNFGIQHQITKTLTGEIQYLGQHGFGLFGERDTNAPPILPDPAHPGFFFFGPRPDPRFSAIRTNENSRTSHFNGLLVSATQRFSSHLQFLASYTWSHAMTSAEDFFGLSEPGDPRTVRPEMGPSFNDIRHAANFGVWVDSGKLANTNVLRWFTNDVSLGWVGQLQSGRPYPFSTGTAGFADGHFFGPGAETQQRPNVLANGLISTAGIASSDGSNALFGPGAVTACTGAGFPVAQCKSIQNTFLAPPSASPLGAVDALNGDVVDFPMVNGNLFRDAARGAPFIRLDMSIKKEFRIAKTERLRLEVRADATNLLNHANWLNFNSNDVTNILIFGSLNPSATPGTGFFNCFSCMRPDGTLIGANGQALRLTDIQHGKLDSNLLRPNFGGIGDPTPLTDTPRVLQLSFHVRF